MIALLIMMAAEIPAPAGERAVARATARIMSAETVSYSSTVVAAGRQKSQVVRRSRRSGRRERLTLTEFQ